MLFRVRPNIKTFGQRSRSIDRTVAVKVLKSGTADEVQQQKFLAEAVVTGETKPYVIYESDETPTVNIEQPPRPTGSDGA